MQVVFDAVVLSCLKARPQLREQIHVALHCSSEENINSWDIYVSSEVIPKCSFIYVS